MQDQILYTVTGGEYDVINREGQIAKNLQSKAARLILADVSVRYTQYSLRKKFATTQNPYHFDVSGGLSPNGFVALKGAGSNLFAVGGDISYGEDTLYQFDTTLPSDPILINTLKLAGPIKDIEVHDNLLYVSSIEGVSIYQITAAKQLQKLTTIDRISLQGNTLCTECGGRQFMGCAY